MNCVYVPRRNYSGIIGHILWVAFRPPTTRTVYTNFVIKTNFEAIRVKKAYNIWHTVWEICGVPPHNTIRACLPSLIDAKPIPASGKHSSVNPIRCSPFNKWLAWTLSGIHTANISRTRRSTINTIPILIECSAASSARCLLHRTIWSE